MAAKKKRILIIDDQEDLLLIRRLEQQECFVTHVIYTNEGLKEGMLSHYDFIFVDVNMPGKNGFQVCRDLNGKTNGAKIYTISISTREDIVEFLGKESGADGHIVKNEKFYDVVMDLINS